MTLPKQWLQHKSTRLIILLASIQIYLIVGQIIPSYEKIPYYQAKIRLLNQQHTKLKLNREHLSFYRDKQSITSDELHSFKRQVDQLLDSGELPMALNRLHLASGLDVLRQQIDQSALNSDFSRITITQSLQGKYLHLVAYLEKIPHLHQFVIVSSCEFINNSPLEIDPTISLNLVLTIYLPLKP
jgi:Tfp pilus assembly protein PilO